MRIKPKKNEFKNLKMNLQFHGAIKNPDHDFSKEKFRESIKQALENNDTEAFSNTFTQYMSHIEQAVIREANGVIAIDDSNILQTRGVRQLTSDENKFYQQTIEAMQSVTPSNSLNELSVVMPETVVDSIFEDLREAHELLSIIDFKNVTGLTRILVNTNAKQLAQWGPLCEEIKKELESGFKEISLEQNKLSAFMFICQDMLDLGPVWIDRYVREVMYEALAFGLEYGIISGTGKNMPIGMTRDISKDVSIVGGEYPEKKAIKVTALDPVTYGTILSKMTKNEKGHSRKISNLLMIVNPTDYFSKVMPSTTIRAADGTYVNNVLPFPTKIVQSTEVEEGKAVIGMADKYFMGMGLIKDGKIEYSDDYKFLEDYRAYKVRYLGHGQAKDDNDFLLLDISGLQPANHKVEIISNSGTPTIPEV